MKEYTKLLVGLITGLALIVLNSDASLGAISTISTLFDPTKINTIFFIIGTWLSRICVILSFVGVCIVIVFSFLIMKKLITTKMNDI